MTKAPMDATLRETIMSDPHALLEDPDVMRALAAAGSRAMGPNVIDLRGLAMERLEARLGRLEDTHRHVVAAAYDNVAGTALVHRAVLRLLEAQSLEALLHDLGTDVAAILRVDGVRLVIESAPSPAAPDGADGAMAERLGGLLRVEVPGFVDLYLGGDRARPRPVMLRVVPRDEPRVHAPWIASEACLRLDLGGGRRLGLLALGSRDPRHFSPTQGTDLLQFLGAAFERVLRRWLG